MAKPNYQFEKRQRELKKIKQQEEKRLKKLAGNAAGETTEEGNESSDVPATPTPEEKTP